MWKISRSVDELFTVWGYPGDVDLEILPNTFEELSPRFDTRFCRAWRGSAGLSGKHGEARSAIAEHKVGDCPKVLSKVLSTAAENLALDEALLEEAEATQAQPDVLRIWESPETAVILGRSSRLADEVRLNRCETDKVPVLRRCSGGAAVVVGPGCLMYSLILSYERYPALRSIEACHEYVLGRLADAVGQLIPNVMRQGISDLTVNQRKFSGNSLRCKRHHLLYHGTVLYAFPLHQISVYLRAPPRQPEYRADRGHGDFVTSLNLLAEPLKAAICQSWQATSPAPSWPIERTKALLAERYAQREWHERF